MKPEPGGGDVVMETLPSHGQVIMVIMVMVIMVIMVMDRSEFWVLNCSCGWPGGSGIKENVLISFFKQE